MRQVENPRRRDGKARQSFKKSESPTQAEPSNRLPASIYGRYVRLRPIALQDHPVLFTWRNDARSLRYWLPTRRVRERTFVDYGEWERTELPLILSGGVSLLAESADSGAPVGVLIAYKFSMVDRWAHYADFFVEPYRRHRGAMEATALFVDHLFSVQSLRKVYGRVPGYNDNLLSKLEALGFEVEVRQKEQTWFEGALWDQFYLGMFREAWSERMSGQAPAPLA